MIGRIDLLRLLSAPEAATSPSLERMRTLVDEAGGRALARDNWYPGHITASGIVMSADGSAALLILHGTLGRWVQPGGHVESEDPSLEAAARREIAEETGLTDLEPLGLLGIATHAFPPRGNEPAHCHFDVQFGYRSKGGTVSVGAGIRAVRWAGLRDRRADGSMRLAIGLAARRIASQTG